MERGVQRWIVDISTWNPSPTEFSNAISLLPQHEHISITRFVKVEDKKRALVSRLLQYVLVHQIFGIPFDEIVINRTVEGKPYLDLREFISSFSSYFSSTEWHKIINAGNCDEMLKELYRYWTLKEAFVKAIGTGLMFRLDQLEFLHNNWTNISVRICKNEAMHWKFWHFELTESLYVSVARGCPCMATESYAEVLGHTDLSDDAYRIGSSLPNPTFMWRTVEQLMPW